MGKYVITLVGIEGMSISLCDNDLLCHHLMHAERFKIIVADDKKAANTLISGTLQLQGFAVYSVSNALECLNRLDVERGWVDAIYVEGKIATERS